MDHRPSPGGGWLPPPAAGLGVPEHARTGGGYAPAPGAAAATGAGTAPHGKRTAPGGPPGGATPPAPRTRRLGLVVAAVLLAGVAGGAWWAITAPEASATQVRLESVASSGSLPFGAPAANDATGVLPPENAGGQLAGNTSGLYTRPAGASPCDTGAIVSGLTSDPAKAAAWAAPMGIGSGDIGGFVGGLSPLVLRADTAVTQYGYAEGQFQPYPSVLQAGTAVLVNSYGEPTVKCYNSNPLGPPTASNTDGELVGTPWAGFTLAQSVTVVAAPAPQTRLVVVDGGSNTQEPEDCPPQTVPPRPNPTPPTTPDKQLMLTGVHNYDGTVTLSDGRIMRADGSFVKPAVTVEHPPGSTILKDGAVQHPDGRVFNINGTERRPMTFQETSGAPPNQIPLGPPRTINPDGSVTPPLANGSVVWNHDGSYMIVEPGTPGRVRIIDQKGVEHPPVPAFPPGSTVNGDGSVTTPGGKILNPNGQERPPKIVLPDDVVLDPKGGNSPPPEKQTATPNEVQLVKPGQEQRQTTLPERNGTVPPEQEGQTPAGSGATDEGGTPAAPGGSTGTGTKAVDCATAPAGTVGCPKVPAEPAKPAEPATGTGTGTGSGQTGGTTSGGDGTAGTGGEAGTGGSGVAGGGSAGGATGEGGSGG